jgi:hypothetical protein
LQLLAPINPNWARVVGYGPFSLCVIHMEGLCVSSKDINMMMLMICCERVMMMMMTVIIKP